MGIVTVLLTELLAQGAPTGAVASDGVYRDNEVFHNVTNYCRHGGVAWFIGAN